MGLIKAAIDTVRGSLADQWLEVIEADNMGDNTVFTSGVKTRVGQNTKGTADLISNGSKIRVYPNQFMMLVDGGKIVDYTAEEGYYTVDDSSAPSLFNGQFGEALKESLNRIKYGGQTPLKQQVFFINLQEIKGIKYGTTNPINYFDTFYNAELFLRCHGNYSIKITDPVLFYSEVIPKNESRVEFTDISSQYQSEFMTALSSSINQMSQDGIRISFAASKGVELSKYMQSALDDDWKKNRGMEVQSVGIDISYDDESKKLINMRNEGAMLSDAGIREGYVQGSIARGLEAAGSNQNGAAATFMGMGMGMNAGGSYMAQASSNNMQQMAGAAAVSGQQTAGGWKCSCGATNTGKFCSNCGQPKPEGGSWTCSCGAVNTGKFCSNCGKARQ